MQVKDLKPNRRNPRKISDKRLAMLKESLFKHGDLSGFVFNVRNKTLNGGHQKLKVIPPNSKIVIEHKYDKPTECGTVAVGYVLIGDERFKYREVDWDEQTEIEAMIAANKHQGEWDREILKLVAADFKGLDWKRAGFEIPELAAFGIAPPVAPPSLSAPLVAPSSITSVFSSDQDTPGPEGGMTSTDFDREKDDQD